MSARYYSDEDVDRLAHKLYVLDAEPGERDTWSTTSEAYRDLFREDARSVLDVVAPSIARRAKAEVLRELEADA